MHTTERSISQFGPVVKRKVHLFARCVDPGGAAYNSDMDTVTVFSANLTVLLAYYMRIGDRTHGTMLGISRVTGLSRTSILRAVRKDGACGIDVAQSIARAYGLDAWQMLIPDLDPSNPPIVSVTPAERQLWERIRSVAKQLKDDEREDGKTDDVGVPRPDQGPDEEYR